MEQRPTNIYRSILEPTEINDIGLLSLLEYFQMFI